MNGGIGPDLFRPPFACGGSEPPVSPKPTEGSGGHGSPAGPEGSVLHLPAGWVAAAMGGEIVAGDRSQVLGDVSIDTRTLNAGDLFVVIEVDDTTVALQRLAHSIRRESGTKVVAITGSAGKTTTKEVTSELLAVRYRVVRNR